MRGGTWERELTAAVEAARAAGAAVRDLYEGAGAKSYVKTDGSPVTDADLASDRIIRDVLGAAFPDDPLLTEEGADDTERLARGRVWVVDPIDGTQHFIDRTGEFDILIALVEADRPVVGVVYQPTTGRCIAATAGGGAWDVCDGDWTPCAARAADPAAPPRLCTSIWLNLPAAMPGLAAAAAELGSPEPAVSPVGVYARHFLPPHDEFDCLIGLPTEPGQTMAWEWDFAAADIVINEAGGRFTDVWGRPFRYNKPVPRNIGGVVLAVDPATHARVIAALAPALPAS